MRQFRAAFACALIAVGFQTAHASAWETDCNAAVTAEMVDSVNSATAFPGMRFRFKVTEDARIEGFLVPAGTIGYGYVRAVSAASNRQRNGSLILEMREIIDGSHRIQVMADPRDTSTWIPATTLADRAEGYLPIPGLVRTAASEVINGKNVTLGPGFTFKIIGLGDPRTTAPCRKVGQ
jgi:hypothetical protein